MNNLLALDQSSHITGYAIFKDGELIQYSKFELNDENIDLRLVKIRDKILDLIYTENINEVVLEDIQQQNNVSNNVKTFKVLAEVYGVICETLEEQRIPHSSILASTWKSSLGIKGRTRAEQKKEAQDYVLYNYGIKATQDICDAICIGLCYLKKSLNDWTN